MKVRPPGAEFRKKSCPFSLILIDNDFEGSFDIVLSFHAKESFFDYVPAYTRRCFDVDSTSFERYGRQMDVETTLCAYWDTL